MQTKKEYLLESFITFQKNSNLKKLKKASIKKAFVHKFDNPTPCV